jgi:dolichyl-phosphate-mannose-protein mannosyltransferase
MRERVEIAVASAVAAVGLFLHIFFFRFAGAFWRDEVISIRVAASPSVTAMLHRFSFDSAFALSTFALRFWMAIAGDSQWSIRLFGLIVGVGVLICAFVAVRQLGGRTPAVAIAILATNAAVVRYGDSIRSYGLGMITGLLAFGAIGRAARSHQTRHWWIAAVAAVLAVQTTYQSSVLIFACCTAAACVQSRREIWKPLAVGAASALTLLPYLGMLTARVNDVFRTAHVTAGGYGSVFVSSLGIVAAVVCVAAFLLRRTIDYVLITVVVLLAAHFMYIQWVGYTPQPWYFTIPIAIIAVAADVSLTQQPLVRAAAAALVVALALPSTAAQIPLRQTNIDQVAAVLERDATRDDLIIVYPWYVDTSFSMYYGGVAAWQSLPPISDHSVQRLDLAARAAMIPGVETALVSRAASVLRAHHSVWLVGFPLFKEWPPRDRGRPSVVEAADFRWCSALADALRRNSRRHAVVVAGPEDVMGYERVNLVKFD